jgi:hypothetical protein
MTDLEKVELAVRRTAQSISDSVWIDEPTRKFVVNVFLALGDEIATIIRRHEGEP